MRIAILSPFYPYRGGIAQFSAMLYNALAEKGNNVKAFNFKKLYPDFLFPGKTQYVEKNDTAITVESDRCLNSINPCSYITTLKHIKAFQPDILIISYWMSFFAPEYAYIAHGMKKRCKVIALVHNAIPHEPHVYDKPLASAFFNQCHGFAAMTQKVADDIQDLSSKTKGVVSPHPLYNQFGSKIDAHEAKEKLHVDLTKKTLLFFGLIRDYKGLDLLIEAVNQLDDSYQLIIAGESYGSFDKYTEQIQKTGKPDKYKVFNHYISDDDVPEFFSASDVCILPYRSATQSGITSIAYNFNLPMIATNTGGLSESIEKPGIGLMAPEITSESIAATIRTFYKKDHNLFVENIIKAKTELTWDHFANSLLAFAETLQI